MTAEKFAVSAIDPPQTRNGSPLPNESTPTSPNAAKLSRTFIVPATLRSLPLIHI